MDDIWLGSSIALLSCIFFSAAKNAFLHSNKLLFELESKPKAFIEKILNLLYKDSNLYLFSMVLAHVTSLVFFCFFSAQLLTPYIGNAISNPYLVLLFTIIVLGIIILFIGEFIPKTLVKINPNRFMILFSIPLFVFYIILYPISKLILLITNLFSKLFRIKYSLWDNKNVGREELDQFLQQTIDDNPCDSELDKEILFFQNAMDFSQVKLRDCIVPRTEIIAVDKTASLKELTTKFIETGLSKIVVYEEDIDNIVGYIHSSELFNKPEDWTEKIITLPFFPENMAANKLMKILLSQKKGMAVVVDEFGGTSGIITLEDLVEEIFGEIEDEHDPQLFVAKQTGKNEYVLSGRMEIDRVNELFDIELPESDEYLTIAGYILSVYQDFPKLNDTITIDQFQFKIIKVTRTKIELVKLTLLEK